MASFLEKKVRAGFGFATLTLLLTEALSYHWLLVSEQNSQHVLLHAHDVLQSIDALTQGMENIEAISRGFAMTGEETDLNNYGADVLGAKQNKVAIRTLTADNPSQQEHFPFIETLTINLIQHADMVISLRRSRGLAAAASAVEAQGNEPIKGEFKQSPARCSRKNYGCWRSAGQRQAVTVTGPDGS